MRLVKNFNDKEQFNYQKHGFSFVRKNAFHITLLHEIVRQALFREN